MEPVTPTKAPDGSRTRAKEDLKIFIMFNLTVILMSVGFRCQTAHEVRSSFAAKDTGEVRHRSSKGGPSRSTPFFLPKSRGGHRSAHQHVAVICEIYSNSITR
jgi:hypothetical protein